MRGAVLFAESLELFADARAALSDRKELIVDSGNEIRMENSQGDRFLMYEIADDLVESTLGDFDFSDFDLHVPQDLSRLGVCNVECRSTSWFAFVMKNIGENVRYSVWVIDSMDNLWESRSIDPSKVSL